jgi:hypothetical protein
VLRTWYKNINIKCNNEGMWARIPLHFQFRKTLQRMSRVMWTGYEGLARILAGCNACIIKETQLYYLPRLTRGPYDNSKANVRR